jgi:hypothetical protein
VDVPLLVTFHYNDPIGFVYGEIEPGELFRALAAELNHGFTIWGIPGGAKKFEEPLFLSLPPLHTSLGVVSFEVSLQVVGLHEPSITAFRCADVRTVVVMDHGVVSQIRGILECLSTSRDIAMKRPLAGVDSLVPNGIARIE